VKIARVTSNSGAVYGLLRDAEVHFCRGTPFSGLEPTGAVSPLNEISLLTPCVPSKMIAVWRNSKALLEARNEQPTIDLCWILKPPSSFAGDSSPIVLPKVANKVIFEAELGIVIGRRCRYVPVEEAHNCILGWTAVNEVTAIDIAAREALFPQHARAKGFDTFGIFGPVIETELDLEAVAIRAWQNGKLRQQFGLADFVRHPYRILSELSHDMTLEPGDLIACGSSVGVAPMQPGDVIQIEISGVGTLGNPVTAESGRETSGEYDAH
jgi:2-keto-4-pentenoate hydratase/2-oxohepta-3-ene-1,7-dioic acid hydratase in catechol pathway